MSDRLERLRAMFTPVHVVGWSKVRVGRDRDGGYVMLDDFKGVEGAISAGIGDEASWDADMARRGVIVHQYDHTIEYSPIGHPLITWFKKGIGPEKGMRTLYDAINLLGHVDLILKMDIEGGEWGALTGMILRSFRQIMVEFHGLLTVSDEKLDRMEATLSYQHELIHIHGNNHDHAGQDDLGVFPNTLEATYIRRDDKKFIPESDRYPIAQDKPNHPYLDDFKMDWWLRGNHGS